MKKKFKNFAEALKCLRLEKNYSLRQLAAKVRKEDGSSISPSYLHDIENNNRIPSANIVVQIAKELAYDADKLLALAEKISPEAEKLLKEQPAAGELLRKARETGFTDWETLKKFVDKQSK